MPIVSALAYAVGTYTSSGVFTDTQTLVIGGKTYTTQTSLTNVDGNVAIGGSAAITLQNLFDAINLTGTPGTQYALAMTASPHVKASAVTATTLVVTATVPGAVSNFVPTTETQTNGSWGAATLASGSGSMATAMAQMIAGFQLNADVGQTIRNIDGDSINN